METNYELNHMWFTADLHINNALVVSTFNRPVSQQEHDQWIIDRINEKVAEDDVLYIVGKVSTQHVPSVPMLSKINCKNIHLISAIEDSKGFASINDSTFKTVTPLKELNLTEMVPPVDIIMCAYPLATWPRKKNGSIQIHGGTKSDIEITGYSIDCGVDSNNFYPISLEEVLKKVEFIKERAKEAKTGM